MVRSPRRRQAGRQRASWCPGSGMRRAGVKSRRPDRPKSTIDHKRRGGPCSSTSIESFNLQTPRRPAIGRNAYAATAFSAADDIVARRLYQSHTQILDRPRLDTTRSPRDLPRRGWRRMSVPPRSGIAVGIIIRFQNALWW